MQDILEPTVVVGSVRAASGDCHLVILSSCHLTKTVPFEIARCQKSPMALSRKDDMPRISLVTGGCEEKEGKC